MKSRADGIDVAVKKKVLVIGGSGHIGGFLVPRLVNSGYEVTILTRGKKTASTGHDGHTEADYAALTREQKWAVSPCRSGNPNTRAWLLLHPPRLGFPG